MQARADARETTMHKIPTVHYPSAEELLEEADKRAAEAARLPPGLARQAALKHAAQLRSYAQMKMLLAAPATTK
jgi:hypothetical protein